MRLLILVASLACASCGVLHGDITEDLRPPQIAASQQQEIPGYATTAGLGASATDAATIGAAASAGGSAPSGIGWVGIAGQQQQQQQALQTLDNYRQEDQGLLASYQPSAQQVANVPQPQYIPETPQVPHYQNSLLGSSDAPHLPQSASLTTGANYQPTAISASGSSGSSSSTGHKYTTVTFGNGLVGLGHSVDYSSIKQSQIQGQTQVQPQVSEQNNYIGEFSGSTGISQSADVYDTISVSQDTPTIPIQISQPYEVPYTRPQILDHGYTDAFPTPVEVPRPIPVEVPHAVSIPIQRPYPVTVERPVPVPQPAYEYVKVEKPLSVKVPVADYHRHHNTHLQHHNSHSLASFNNFKYQPELPLTATSFQETTFHKDHYKPLTTFQPHLHYQQKDHLHQYQNDHNHHDATHHLGSNHHSSSILAGLSGGLSSKLRGGHGASVSHHHGVGHGAAGNFGGDLKFANGLDAHLGHTSHAGYKLGHGFSGSLGVQHSGYANGYAGKYLSGGDYAKHTYPSFGSFSQEKVPVKYSTGSTFSGGKYGGFPAYHIPSHGASSSFSSSGASFGSSFKIPETINQQYDANGGYKY